MGTSENTYPETDQTYEDERKKAEREYFIASANWLSELVVAIEKTPTPPPPIMNHLAAVAAAALRGDPIPEHKLDYEAPMLLKLAWMCSDFARADLRAYVGLLERTDIPTSQKVKALEQRAKATGEEIFVRKWTPGVRQMSERFHSQASEQWREVVEAISETLADLEPNIWFDFAGSGVSETAEPWPVSDSLPTSDRSECLVAFKRRARQQGITVTDQMVAQAASKNWNDRTQVTWWKRYDKRSGDAHDRLIRAVLQKDPAALWPKK